jgi:hypothetical protein
MTKLFFLDKDADDSQSKRDFDNCPQIITNFDTNIPLMKSFYEVKNEINSIYSEDYFSDSEIMRYVYGLRGETNKIIISLIELDKFRRNLKRSEIKHEEFDLTQFRWDLFCQILCLDAYMRPVIIVRLYYLKYIQDKQFFEKIIRYFLYIFNKAIFLMPANVDKYVVIVDCKNSSLENIPEEYINKLCEILKNYYVERLANLFIIKKGMMFPMMWKVLSCYLDRSNVVDKITVLKDYKEDLRRLIPEDFINLI